MLEIKFPKSAATKLLEAAISHYKEQFDEHAEEYDKCVKTLVNQDYYELDGLIDSCNHYGKKLSTYEKMLEAVAFSAGDVYMSYELWNELKEFSGS